MFKSKTVFIVGAGASAEAKLPIGSELTQKIAALVNFRLEAGRDLNAGDYPIYQALRRLVDSDQQFARNTFIASGRALADAMDLAPSIDTFLETHAENQEYVRLGKLGIVRAITMAEQASSLAPPKDTNKPFRLRDLTPTWYPSLAQQLFTGVAVAQPEKAFTNVSFIVFNYDRCVQTYLVRAVEAYFRISRTEAESLIRGIDFIHPYGSLGSIYSCDPDHVPFASDISNLLEASSRIRTFSESADLVDDMLEAIEEAETLIFLGFGFHDQNVALLTRPAGSAAARATKRVFATTCGLSDSDCQVVRRQLVYLVKGRYRAPDESDWLFTHNGTCASLFSSYWRSLTASK